MAVLFRFCLRLAAIAPFLVANMVYAQDAAGPGSSCAAGHTAGAEQAHNNGIFLCTTTGATRNWYPEPLYIGVSSATCDTAHASLLRYNSGSLEVCNGSAWVTAGSGSSIDGLSDAFTDYASEHNFIMGRASAAALPSGAINNTFIGEGAGATTANSTSATDDNTAIGYYALAGLTTGIENTAVGVHALYANTTGSLNTAMGEYALSSNIDGSDNTAFGADTLVANTSGASNTAVGRAALNVNVTGVNNTAVGKQAGNSITTGSGNILLGYDVDTPTATTSNHLNIGNTIYGNISTGSVGIGTTSPQSTLHVPDGKYAQFEDSNAGAPPAGDCDNNAERGRMSIDTTNNRLYICNGATRGWDYVALTD